jgi:transposase InsO family protein
MELRDIPSRYRLRVKQRLGVVGYAREHGLRAAARRFGLNRGTVRDWHHRWKALGPAGLVPAYPPRRHRRVGPETIELLRYARVDLRYGAPRTRIWLQRVHNIRLTTMTIQRVFRDLGLPRLTRTPRRRPRQLKLFEKDNPGDSVQVDVKFVETAAGRGYQYTAIDDCTRYRVLRLYPRCNQAASISFLREIKRVLPFPVRKLQTDNGSEFALDFMLSVQEAGIRHRYIRPRRPQQNGKVERSHRIDNEEFWGRHEFASLEEATPALAAWESAYNYSRFSMALGGQTPAERLASKLAAQTAADTSAIQHGPVALGGAPRATSYRVSS